MRCANCGRELEFGTWENEPAYKPCHFCYAAAHAQECADCEPNNDIPDDYGYCPDCEDYNRGCDDTRHDTSHELDELRAEMVRRCEEEYNRGYDEGVSDTQ